MELNTPVVKMELENLKLIELIEDIAILFSDEEVFLDHFLEFNLRWGKMNGGARE